MDKNEFRHLINISDVLSDGDTSLWDELYSRFRDIIAHQRIYSDALRGSVMASLFFEPSTRTKFSFQSAMLRLGGSVFGFESADATSVKKGESLADTIRMNASYSDIIVMRHPVAGAPLAASLYSEVPIVNAGDGGRQHPTQTLTDLATLATVRGKIGDFTIGLCGDLKYGRTVHSLVYALSNFPGIKYVFISPNSLSMPDNVLGFMREHNLPFSQAKSIDDALPELDVLYMTRAQAERMSGEDSKYSDGYILTAKKLERAKKDLTILHPLPRVNEITPDVDADPRAKYFEQAKYGVFIRMSLLLTLARQPHESARAVDVGGCSCKNEKCITHTELYLPKILTPDGRCAYCDE